MDKIDKHILAVLQKNCKISNQDLADEVALSPSPCLRRVKQLEESGVISKQVALLDASQIGLKLTVFVLIGLDSHAVDKMQQFDAAIKNIPEVIECHLITGQSADYLLKVMVPDMQGYDELLLKKLANIKGVNSVHSSFALRSVKNDTALPLNYV